MRIFEYKESRASQLGQIVAGIKSGAGHFLPIAFGFLIILQPLGIAFAQNLEPRQTYELDLDSLSKMVILTDQYQFNMQNYIPLQGLPENDDGRVIARRILRHTLQNFIDRSKDLDAPAIRGASKINENMKTSIGDGKNSIRLRVRPFETKAEVKCQTSLGFDSRYSYEFIDRESRVEFSTVIRDKTYGYTVATDPTQTSNIVGVRWGF